ncbi:DMT family transporter [Sphingomonas sp. SM33]|uniref:DMT family transporter n=1 Tax=Sphingomonas telluris TaxID=2907998 RepID=A0ABS9VQG7_9SPHN|nr:DMT family transporter [Sphingomonas telluris]
MNRVVQHPIQAFAAALAAVGILSIMDAVMKALVLAIGIYAVSLWRAVVTLIMSGALYLPRRLPRPSRSVMKIHVARGVIVTIMAGLFFWGIGRVPLAQAIALTFIAPLIALMLAAAFLHERIGSRSILGSLAAFGGVIVIVLGQARAELGPEVLLGSLAIIGSALCYACNIVMMRHQALAAKPLEITFFQSLTITILWLSLIPFAGMPLWPAGKWWIWIWVAAAMSTTGGLLFAWAYARAEASYLAVTEYSAFLWAAALGWIVFSERVSLYTVAGAVLIVGGCIVAARGKSKQPGEVEVAT